MHTRKRDGSPSTSVEETVSIQSDRIRYCFTRDYSAGFLLI